MSRCHHCGKADLVEHHRTVDYPQAGLPYPVLLVDVPVRECPACGETAITLPDVEGLHRALCRHIIHASRAMSGREVRFLRKYLGWRAEYLAAVMGVDPKTLSRWENGRQKVGPVAERLLRLLVLQRLEADPNPFVDTVLPTLTLAEAATVEPLRLTLARTGWRQAA